MNQNNDERAGGRGFANDPERAREAGRKGGKASHQNQNQNSSGEQSSAGSSESEFDR